MIAKVQFFKPFDEISGKQEMEIGISSPMAVKDFLRILAEKIPSLRAYLRKEGDEITNFFVILVRGDEILKIKDKVYEKDVIKILPPVSGG
ncbi:MAG: MoaD/ThiS family protein [Thermodesulfobacteriota bacterium]